jgi:dTDP-glucose pyrophosphorylase
VSTPNPHQKTIILCGGRPSTVNVTISTSLSNAMTPINGKPIIGWILDDLLEKNIQQATIVLRHDDYRLQGFLERAYCNRMQLSLVPLAASDSILESLHAGLEDNSMDCPVRIILGDTLISDTFTGDEDFIYVGEVEESRRWSLPVLAEDGRVVDYLDKKGMGGGPFKAVAGYYHLQHGDFFSECVSEGLATGGRELSDALRRYGEKFPIVTKPVTEWYDFGHIDNVVAARRSLLKPRHFNSLTVNPVLNTITKVSKYDEKLRDELDWYLDLPDELKVLSPRIVSFERNNGSLQIVQEYYGYPTLAELYVYGDLDADTWLSVLRKVLRIHQEFRRFPGQVEPDAIKAMYAAKTWQRLEELRAQSKEFDSLLSAETLIVNGKTLRNLQELRTALSEKVEELSMSAPIHIVHGDFCFSNILFDPNNQILRLIDPRGSFGTKGIYGDARYDIAKLRHSVAGFYDFIVTDMFELRETNHEFASRSFVNGLPAAVANSFDQMVIECGYDLSEIKLIEGLLFISMLPLHRGNLQRQKMMYLTGISRLNEVL